MLLITACLAMLFFRGLTCENSVTVLVQYGCDTEDLIVETWDGVEMTELTRFAPGSAPVCFSVAESTVSLMYSRCESESVAIPVTIGVFDPGQECNE